MLYNDCKIFQAALQGNKTSHLLEVGCFYFCLFEDPLQRISFKYVIRNWNNKTYWWHVVSSPYWTTCMWVFFRSTRCLIIWHLMMISGWFQAYRCTFRETLLPSSTVRSLESNVPTWERQMSGCPDRMLQASASQKMIHTSVPLPSFHIMYNGMLFNCFVQVQHTLFIKILKHQTQR